MHNVRLNLRTLCAQFSLDDSPSGTLSTKRKILVFVVLLTVTFLLVRAYLSEVAMLSRSSEPDLLTHIKTLANMPSVIWNFGTSPLGLIFVLVSFFILFDAFKVWRHSQSLHK